MFQARGLIKNYETSNFENSNALKLYFKTYTRL